MLAAFLLPTLLAATGNAAPPGPSPGAVGTLSLESWLEAFLAIDASYREALVDPEIAKLGEEQARERFAVSVSGGPTLRGDYFAFGGGADSQTLGSGSVNRANAQIEDNIGGTLSIDADATVLNKPGLSPGGNQLSAAISYSLPLLRNAFGRLYSMEARYLALAADARRATTRAVLAERCAEAGALYADAYVIQEQWQVWQELFSLKREVFERTKRDYNRRLITRLDYLAAQSDWLATKQRSAELDGLKNRALATIASYAGTPKIELADPNTLLQPLQLPAADSAYLAYASEHPRAKAVGLDRESIDAQAEFTAATVDWEVFLTPQFGVSHYSRLFQPPGLNDSLTDTYGLLALTVDLPIIAPRQRFDVAILHERGRQLEARRVDFVRSVVEQLRRSEATFVAVSRRLALTQEKRDVLKEQLEEARRRFQLGQLEYQDFLQHWTAYEDVRFEAVNLRAQAWTAVLRQYGASGELLPGCWTGDQ